jgi:hypothetical protein
MTLCKRPAIVPSFFVVLFSWQYKVQQILLFHPLKTQTKIFGLTLLLYHDDRRQRRLVAAGIASLETKKSSQSVILVLLGHQSILKTSMP